MTGPKGHEAPLSMECNSSNSSGRQALYQHARLEPGRPRQRSRVRAQSLVALPREALPILEKIHTGHTDGVLSRHVTELQHQHLACCASHHHLGCVLAKRNLLDS